MLQLRNAIHLVYSHDQNIHLVTRSKTKNKPNTFLSFVLKISVFFYNVLVILPDVFSSTKTNPQKQHPAHLLPPFCFTHGKKSGLAKGGYSKAPSPNQRASCNPWCFLFHKKHIIFGCHPSSSRGMWKNNAGCFLGDTF